MKGNEAVVALIESLEALGIHYMVTGSYASNVHGVPRSTMDADFIIEAPPEEVDRLLDGLKPPLRPASQMLFETVTSSHRWMVRVDRSAFTLELFLLNNHPFDRSRFDRRTREEVLPGIMSWLPTAEDVIVQKLRWSVRAKRPKDFKDACEVISVQRNRLDWPYIEQWCAELEASAALAEARSIAEG
ncbi:MAG: hypothetical protein EOP83_26990 [Verrucomicrobiaceae bacterium]|nr:MAG: hypothetical protein EOP83_26990 [Verrucomicrobiaceae bacterium]